MIKNKKLLIDADCPLCRMYGSGFEKFHFIDSRTVTYYQTSADDYCWRVNLERAKSEIAFTDVKTGHTSYGIDAFIEIIGSKFPGLNAILHFSPVYFLLRKFYRFVSFNRKVIATNSAKTEGLSCNPPVHRAYRWTYILLTSFFTGFVLSKFGNRLNTALGFTTIPHLEYAICLGQIVWQGMVISISFPKKALNYLGNMSTVSLLGALLLLPVLLIDSIVNPGAIYLLISFGLVVLIMINSHLSRCRNLGISNWLTLSWISYRALILAGIIYINFSL